MAEPIGENMEKTVELYELTPEEINLFKNKSGIYGLVHNNQIIYVGQSKNLSDRLNTHRRANTDSIIKRIIKDDGQVNHCKALAMYYFIEAHRDEIFFVILQETKELDSYEEHYISLFKPRYNYKGVDVPYKKESMV